MDFKNFSKYKDNLFPYKNLFVAIHDIRKKIFYLKKGGEHESSHAEKHHPWYSVLWLTGVDYFSTLAYQPGIAMLAVGALSPFSTLLLVMATLFGAVPIYFQIVNRSFTGQGSIALLEKQLSGWIGKLCVLMLIGFAATDFFITITLAASDAAAHLIQNPYTYGVLEGYNLSITLVLILLLSAVFLKGFKEAIGFAIFSAFPYLVLTLVTVIACFLEIYQHPEYLQSWFKTPVFYADWRGIFILSALAFPRLALGLSGFETGASVISLIKNDHSKNDIPVGRILGAKKLLFTSAIIMSLFLMASSIITPILLTKADVAPGGIAADRVLSYLAHHYLGDGFGTLYDVFTILILWFAGASAMAGLLNLLPRYLPRFGMAPSWVAAQNPLIILITVIAMLITWIFNANVDAQAGAYATGVLALILSAGISVSIAFLSEWRITFAKVKIAGLIYFSLMTLVFLYVFVENVRQRPDGLTIASIFFLSIVIFGAISRYVRSYELRVKEVAFASPESQMLWERLKELNVNLIPLSFTKNDPESIAKMEKKMGHYYNIQNNLAFLFVQLRDDRSDFDAPLNIHMRTITGENEQLHYIIEIYGAVAIPNTISYVSEAIDPIAIYLGMGHKNGMEHALEYILFGQGEIGIITCKILFNQWENADPKKRKPKLFLMS